MTKPAKERRRRRKRRTWETSRLSTRWRKHFRFSRHIFKITFLQLGAGGEKNEEGQEENDEAGEEEKGEEVNGEETNAGEEKTTEESIIQEEDKKPISRCQRKRNTFSAKNIGMILRVFIM